MNDLTGTDARTVDVDLQAFAGGGDGQIDTVIARGTAGADSVTFGSAAGAAVVSGLGAKVQASGGEATDEVVAATLGGDDTFAMTIGTPGTATVNADGGEGTDTVRYSGTAGDDQIPVVANGAEAAVAPAGTARLDAFAVESLVLAGLAGADTITAVGNLAALTTLTYDGGPGDDDLRGGNGADLLLGGTGNDSVDGNQGLDRALLGSGDDRFQWDPGDGNDTVEGDGGDDLLDFFGSAAGETVDIAANGDRVRFTRNIASIVMDLNDVDRIRFHALGGADTTVVNDLAGTDVDDVYVDLSAFGGVGDGLVDAVIARGTDGADRFASPPRAATRSSPAWARRSSWRASSRRSTTSTCRRSAARTRSRRAARSSGRPRTTSTAATAPTSPGTAARTSPTRSTSSRTGRRSARSRRWPRGSTRPRSRASSLLGLGRRGHDSRPSATSPP